MAETMDYSYAFHPYSRSMASLASTIVPVHSDASTFTSVTTSPMDFQDPLAPSTELKIPLPDADPPLHPSQDGVNTVDGGGTPIPEPVMGLSEESSHTHPSVESSIQGERDGEYTQREHPAGERSRIEGPTPERSEEADPSTSAIQRPLQLSDVRHLVGLEQYHRQRTLSLQHTLESLTRTCGLNGRLIPGLASAYRTMADCYQSGDSPGFAKIYRICETLVGSCVSHALQPIVDGRIDLTDQEYLHSASWLEKIPQGCQGFILGFLTSLRTETNFFADRLSSLSFNEFTELLGLSQPSRKPQSIFEVRTPRSTTGHAANPSRNQSDPIPDRLWNFHQGNPLFVLFHGIFDNACKPGTKEHYMRSQVWSAACARVICDGKPGSDEFITSTLDTISDSSDWNLKPQLETYIAKVLQDGAFVVDPTSKEPIDFKEPLEIRNANAVITTSNFFDKATKDLLALILSSSPANMVPDGLHTFICCMLAKISNGEVRNRARNFVFSKWFIPMFLARALTHPEHYGMMMSRHICAKARNGILREISSRLQKQVFDTIFSWKTAIPLLDPRMHTLIEQLMDRFDASDSSLEKGSSTPLNDVGSGDQILMLSAHDIAGLLRALYPRLTDPASSANPSTAGSSTLVPESVRLGQGKQSSTPSLSELSVSSASAYKVESPRPWMYPIESNQTEVNANVASLLSRNGEAVKHPEAWLIRSYRCLMSILGPLPAANTEVASPDWAFFRTNDEGKVHCPQPHHTRAPGDQHIPREGHASSGAADNVSMKDLKPAIIRLLGLNGPVSISSHQHSLPNSAQSDEILSELNILISVAVDRATVAYDFQDLHYWWHVQKLLQDYEGSVNFLLRSIHEDSQRSMRVNHELSSRIDKQLHKLSSLQNTQTSRISSERKQCKALRLKMWYASDVRHSSTFENALHVTQALRAMADTSRSRQPTGVANWARNRLRNTAGVDRTSAQTLEAMTEPNEHSGNSKLNDDQVERTTSWLTKHSVENFCRGEERIHRFCLEVQKSVNKLTGPTLLESPVLWSSSLFEQEKKSFTRKPQDSHETRHQRIHRNISSTNNAYSPATLPTLASQQRHSISQNGMSSRLVRLSQTEDRFGIGLTRSQSTLNDASAREPVRSLPSHGSHKVSLSSDSAWLDYPSEQAHSSRNHPGARQSFIAEVKQGVSSLILSDLGLLLWRSGTETDTWLKYASLDDSLLTPRQNTASPQSVDINDRHEEVQVFETSGGSRRNLKRLFTVATAAKQDLTSRWSMEYARQPDVINSTQDAATCHETTRPFPYKQAYKAILERFSFGDNPQTKLHLLHDLEQLVAHSIQGSLPKLASTRTRLSNGYATKDDSFHLRSMVIPRTKATSFEEVIANCTERRAGTMRFRHVPKTAKIDVDMATFGTDEIVNTILSIFRDPELRPPTLFRDLQYIAAFVPAEILDQTAQGKAFWDAGLAALALKQDLCDAMIDRATAITTYHISASSSSSDPPSSIPQNLSHTSLRDAAQLWIIAAKEGSATAARELGLLYLTHPELLPRTTLQPFAKPKVVFKTVGAKRESLTAEEGRLDPVTFAVVFHWMEVAANGGDKDARDFLKSNGEWGPAR